MRPVSSNNPRRPRPRGPAEEYRAKADHEAARISRRLRDLGYPPPLGDLSFGVVLAVEPPAGPRLVEAVRRSLESVNLTGAYVTWSPAELLAEELLAANPSILVAAGPRAAREIDSIGYPLVRKPFSEATEGTLFSWTGGVTGLLLPSLAPALEDEAAKKRFWRAFLMLRSIA
ncbi:MAG: hypothetical protein ACR2GU_10875 [Rubrobacteraceae bacterium]